MFHMFRIVRQYDSVDCALACLKMICQHYKMYGSPVSVWRILEPHFKLKLINPFYYPFFPHLVKLY